MKTVVSSPGKIHLMGEHAVVHGAPAILAAINRRLVVTISPSSTLTIKSREGDVLIQEAIKQVCDRFKLDPKPKILITVSSSIPTGMHLGSSAAVSVATVGALLYHLKKIWNPDLINKLAYEVEKKQHGTPSGGDNSICTYGGFVWFRKELEFIKTIWQLPFQPSQNLAPFYLIDTGRPKENTGDMVAMVHQFVKKNPKKARDVFFNNETATKDITTAVKSGDEPLLIAAIIRGENTLEQMGVVSEKIKPIIRAIEKSGGAAKILGGGGKKDAVGFLLAYHREKKKLEKIALKHDKQVYNIVLGEEGVRLESGRNK